ncbi:hypothetical protein Tco_0797500 [Tanacetum coccineum]
MVRSVAMTIGAFSGNSCRVPGWLFDLFAACAGGGVFVEGKWMRGRKERLGNAGEGGDASGGKGEGGEGAEAWA